MRNGDGHSDQERNPSPCFLGLDLILGSNGEWSVLEANSHPIGLDIADTITRHYRGEALFGSDSVTVLASELVSSASPTPICLLLPECFRIQTPDHCAEQIGFAPSPQLFDDFRLSASLVLFNSLARSIRAIGHACVIADVEGLTVIGKDVCFTAGGKVGLLFRRAHRYPQIEVRTPCVNDLRLKLMCTKLRAYGALCPVLSHRHLPRTFVFKDTADVRAFLEEQALHDAFVIAKPIWGAASQGVIRPSARDAFAKLKAEGDQSDYVLQNWIEPATVESEKGSYYFDVRVFTINSRPFAGFARRAAAPVSARTIHSPLAWLTTTGTCLPLAKTAAGDDGSAVVLSERQRDDLFEICRNASRALQHAALASDYSLSVGSTLEFGKNPANLNAGGDFALIPLVEKC